MNATLSATLGSGLFIAGTDTGVGKSLAACALLHALRAHPERWPRVVGMKPVAAGAAWHQGQWANEDALALRAASSIAVPAQLDNPVLLPEPLSPHIAAARAGQTISIAAIAASYQQLAQQADAVVVEGAGGWHVPLSQQHTGADLAQALGLPVLLVVGLRLGCLNHAALSAQAIAASGLPLAGWVANHLSPDMPAAQDNIAWLRQRLGAPLWAELPYQAQAQPDARALAAHFTLFSPF